MSDEATDVEQALAEALEALQPLVDFKQEFPDKTVGNGGEA